MDRRYTFLGCPCGDAFCAGCADVASEVDAGMIEVSRAVESADGPSAAEALTFRRGESMQRQRDERRPRRARTVTAETIPAVNVTMRELVGGGRS